MQKAWILRFGEIGLKSKVVRRQFTRALTTNMKAQFSAAKIPIIKDRIETMDVVTSTSATEDVEDLLCHVLGVVAIDPAELISDILDPDFVAAEILSRDQDIGKKRTFGVRVRRIGPKGEWNSQSYSSAIGSSMYSRDNNLKVNLTNPDMWVRLVLGPHNVWLMGERIEGAGGLPPGVQGNVLSRIKDEESLLSAFLIMRRGSRIIPVDGSETQFVDLLKKWDPFLGTYSTENSVTGGKRKRHPWGVVGISLEEGESLIERRESDVKTVPLSTLEPLCGWTNKEKESLSQHVRNPSNYTCMPDIEGWVS
ncbi:MAG: THUMP domain-containing protein [Candidatus Poseidoniaceae archaeon]|nr:THUMP domain-containing protein [Candidatus Poseidoniaceae archaeon]